LPATVSCRTLNDVRTELRRRERRLSMSAITIYHNPRCSKSRATLELVERHGAELKVVEYLTTPPTAKELEALVAKLGIEPEQLVRKGEDVYKQEYAGKTLSRAQWIEAMVRHPILIERPIVVAGERAVIGRPPENVRALLEGL
jgi:arsenate reductase